jgi:hypothetical protein
MDAACYGQTVFQFLVVYTVAPDKDGPGFVYLLKAALQDFLEDFFGHVGDGKTDDVHGSERLAPHGVDVAQGIGGCNTAKVVGIIHNRGDKIDGLDQGQIIIEFVNASIVGGFYTYQKIRMADSWQVSHDFFQVPWTQLGCSARGPDFFGQTNDVFGAVHGEIG